MNICFLSYDFPNPMRGGIENITFRLAIELQKRNNNVYIITNHPNNFEGVFPFQYIYLNNISPDNLVLLKNFIIENNIEVIINQSNELITWEIVKKIKNDFPSIKLIRVLHTDPLYVIKGLEDLLPLTITPNLFEYLKQTFFNIIRKYKRKKFIAKTYHEWEDVYDRIVLLSENFIPDFQKIAKFKDPHKILAINNFILPPPHKITIFNKEKIVVWVGRLEKNAKRPDRMISIWEKIYKRFPDWHLYIIGDGSLKVELEEYVLRKQISNITFTGQTNPISYYKKASILCITSSYEGMPIVCYEALAYGVIPIIFDSFKSISDLIIHNYNGLLIKPFKLNQYYKLLKTLLEHECVRIKLYKNIMSNSEFNKRISVSSIIQNWEGLLHNLNSNKCLLG